MYDISEILLVEALADWGAHEASGWLKDQITVDTTDKLACINVVLHYFSPYMSRILGRGPMGTFAVTFEPSDAEYFILADGRSLDEWIRDTAAEGGESYDYFCRLVEDPSLARGRIYGVCQVNDPQAQRLSTTVIYDGWHRTAAWYERCQRGQTAPLPAYLTVAQRPDPMPPAEAGAPIIHGSPRKAN